MRIDTYMKRNITLSIDEDIIKDAKIKRVNISHAAELGLMKKINMKEVDMLAQYPENLAKDDPLFYWIDPKDGKCHKRGEFQFFIKDGKTPILCTEMQWRLAHNTAGHGKIKKHIRRIVE